VGDPRSQDHYDNQKNQVTAQFELIPRNKLEKSELVMDFMPSPNLQLCQHFPKDLVCSLWLGLSTTEIPFSMLLTFGSNLHIQPEMCSYSSN